MPKTKPKPEPEAKPMLPVETTEYSADWWNPKGLMEAREMASEYAASDLVPKEYRGKAGNVLVAWSLGAPLGLSVLSSLTHIAVINGKPTIYGDAAAAIVRAHPLCRLFQEPQVTGSGDDMEAICTIQRGSEEPVIRSFSVGDAKTAKLWGRTNRDGSPTPWVLYPKRMLQMRARSWAMRDAFPDALCGMPIFEEVRDITPEVTVRDAEPEGATATERLKNKLKTLEETSAASVADSKTYGTDPAEEALEDVATLQEAESRAEAQPGEPAEEKGPGTPLDDAEPSEGVEEPPEKTVEDYIAEAKDSEELTRLMAEINHRHNEKQIDTKRWGELAELIQARTKEIAKGGKKG